MTLLTLMAATGLGCADQTVFLEDRNNYTFESSLTLSTIVAQPGVDLTFDWCGLTQDFLGVPIEPTHVTRIEITAWEMSAQELQDTLVATQISQQALGGQADLDVEGVCTANVASMRFLGTLIDPAEYLLDNDNTYLVTLYEGQVARMTGLFDLDPESSNTLVTLDNDSALVTIEVDLSVEETILDPAAVDWSYLTTDGGGYPIALNKLSELWVMHFDEDLATIEADFTLLEVMAESITTWSSEALLELELSDPEDAASSLFDDTGTWLLAMRCGSCTNPAPPFLTVVEVE
jgi:hypothetical protein